MTGHFCSDPIKIHKIIEKATFSQEYHSTMKKKIQIRKFYIFFSTTFLYKNRFPITKNTWNPRKYHFYYPLCSQVVLKFNNVIHKTVSLFEAISLRTGAQSRYRRLPIFPWWIDSDRYSGSSLSNIYRIRYVLQCLDRLMTSKTVKSFEGVEQAMNPLCSTSITNF